MVQEVVAYKLPPLPILIPVVCKLPPLRILCGLPLISLLMPVVRSVPTLVLMPVWELFPLAILMPLLSLLTPVACGVCVQVKAVSSDRLILQLLGVHYWCPLLVSTTACSNSGRIRIFLLSYVSLIPFIVIFVWIFFLLLLHPWCFIVIVGIPSEGFEPVTQLEALFKLGKMVRPCHVTA